MLLSKEEKFRILKTLEEDLEFRYAVAGLIGVSELLKRLDTFEENQAKLLEEVRGLRENQEKIWQGQSRLWEEAKSLRESEVKLWEEARSLRESEVKLWDEVRSLREVQSAILNTQKDILRTLNRVVVTVDRLTISVEDEARDVVRHRLKNELGLDVALDRLFFDEFEMNIYGAQGDFCVIGEATVRLGVRLIEELEDKIEDLKIKRPDLIRPKMIKVVYADYAVPAALELAKNKGVWALKWSGDLTPRVIHETKVE